MPRCPKILSRRMFLAGASAAAPLLAGSTRAWAADSTFPSKNIDFIIPKSPGGGFDNLVRVVVPAMERFLPHKVNVVPDNIPAGGGGKGITQLYRSKPDGYTIGAVDLPGSFVLQQRQGGVAFDLNKIVWLGLLGRPDSFALAVGANSPLKSMQDLRALSKTRAVKFTSSGPEGTAYAATVIATKILGMNARMIAGYKGSSDFVVGAMRGDGDAVVAPVTTLLPMVQAKTMRILANFETRSTFPGVPDVAALGHPELAQILLVRIVGAPPGLPAGTKTILAAALNKSMADPETVRLAKNLDVVMSPQTAEETEAIVRQSAALLDKWKQYLAA
jgi:tripartite-type tricarboxylate transporter receptor subunit TctC